MSFLKKQDNKRQGIIKNGTGKLLENSSKESGSKDSLIGDKESRCVLSQGTVLTADVKGQQYALRYGDSLIRADQRESALKSLQDIIDTARAMSDQGNQSSTRMEKDSICTTSSSSSIGDASIVKQSTVNISLPKMIEDDQGKFTMLIPNQTGAKSNNSSSGALMMVHGPSQNAQTAQSGLCTTVLALQTAIRLKQHMEGIYILLGRTLILENKTICSIISKMVYNLRDSLIIMSSTINQNVMCQVCTDVSMIMCEEGSLKALIHLIYIWVITMEDSLSRTGKETCWNFFRTTNVLFRSISGNKYIYELVKPKVDDYAMKFAGKPSTLDSKQKFQEIQHLIMTYSPTEKIVNWIIETIVIEIPKFMQTMDLKLRNETLILPINLTSLTMAHIRALEDIVLKQINEMRENDEEENSGEDVLSIYKLEPEKSQSSLNEELGMEEGEIAEKTPNGSFEEISKNNTKDDTISGVLNVAVSYENVNENKDNKQTTKKPIGYEKRYAPYSIKPKDKEQISEVAIEKGNSDMPRPKVTQTINVKGPNINSSFTIKKDYNWFNDKTFKFPLHEDLIDEIFNRIGQKSDWLRDTFDTLKKKKSKNGKTVYEETAHYLKKITNYKTFTAEFLMSELYQGKRNRDEFTSYLDSVFPDSVLTASKWYEKRDSLLNELLI